jgi:general secretion pathway protein M
MTIPSIDTTLGAIKEKIGLDQLSTRETITLAAGVVFIVCVVIYQFVLSPYIEARSSLQSSIVRKQTELVEIRQLQQQYSELRAEEGGIKANLAKRQSGFTLFTFLDQQAEKARIKPQIKYMKPSVISGDGPLDESIVEIKLQEVTLERLVHFLRLTESDTNVVSVRRLSVQTSAQQEGYLDVILQIVTFVEAGEA